MSNSLQTHGLQPARLFCLWIPQARILERVAVLISRRSSQPRDCTQISCIAGGFLPSDPRGKPLYFLVLTKNKCLEVYIFSKNHSDESYPQTTVQNHYFDVFIEEIWDILIISNNFHLLTCIMYLQRQVSYSVWVNWNSDISDSQVTLNNYIISNLSLNWGEQEPGN